MRFERRGQEGGSGINPQLASNSSPTTTAATVEIRSNLHPAGPRAMRSVLSKARQAIQEIHASRRVEITKAAGLVMVLGVGDPKAPDVVTTVSLSQLVKDSLLHSLDAGDFAVRLRIRHQISDVDVDVVHDQSRNTTQAHGSPEPLQIPLILAQGIGFTGRKA